MNEIRKLTMEANNLMDSTNLSDLSDLGGDNKMANTPAEIYARIRADTIEECAKVAESYADRCNANHWNHGGDAGYDVAGYIRALKREPE